MNELFRAVPNVRFMRYLGPRRDVIRPATYNRKMP